MTRAAVAEKLIWVVVGGGITVGWAQGWNPMVTAVGMLLAVAGLYFWSRRTSRR